MKQKAIIVMLVWCFCQGLSAQDFKSDIEKINAKYSDSSFHLMLTYNYYNELKSIKPDEVLKGEVRKQNQNYYVKMHKMEVMISNQVFLQVSHDLKAIILDSSKPAYYAMMGLPLDSLMLLYKNVQFKDRDSLTGVYKIPSMAQGIAHTNLVFNKITHAIEQMEIYFYDLRKSAEEGTLRNKLIIQYNKADFNPKFSAKSFSQAKYIRKTAGKYTVNKAYQHYQLVNNL